MRYGDDNDDLDILKKIKLKAAGGSLPTNEMDDEDARIAEAINTSAGVMGTVKGPNLAKLKKLVSPAAKIAEEQGLQAGLNHSVAETGVKLVPSIDDIKMDALKASYKDLPKNFFDENRRKAAEAAGKRTFFDDNRTRAIQKAMAAAKEAEQSAIPKVATPDMPIQQEVLDKLKGSQFDNPEQFARLMELLKKKQQMGQ